MVDVKSKIPSIFLINPVDKYVGHLNLRSGVYYVNSISSLYIVINFKLSEF